MNRLISGVCMVLAVLAAVMMPAHANGTSLSEEAATRAAEEMAQREAAQAFITAFIRRKMPEVRTGLATRPEHLFGAFPFEEMPTLETARVRKAAAVIEFSGKPIDPKLPKKGGILLHKVNGTWKVWQIFFYNRLPTVFNLPTRSVSDTDRAQEGAVDEVGQRFMRAWQAQDLKATLAESDPWQTREDDPLENLKMGKMQLVIAPSKLGDPLASYTVRLTYQWGILGYSMDVKGGVFLVKENDAWKVRGNVMSFAFPN